MAPHGSLLCHIENGKMQGWVTPEAKCKPDRMVGVSRRGLETTAAEPANIKGVRIRVGVRVRTRVRVKT